MLVGVEQDELALGRRPVGPSLCVVLARRVDGIRPLGLRREERDVRQDLDRRIEQDGPPDTLGVQSGELEDEPAAEGVANPVHRAEVEGLDQIGDVLGERPRRLPPRAAVAAQVGREHAKAGAPALLREPAEALAVPGHAVQADDGRCRRVAPIVHV